MISHLPSPDNTELPAYLKSLPVSLEVQRQLSMLGVGDSVSLLGMIQANPIAFDDWIGPTTRCKISEYLEAVLPRDSIDCPGKSDFTYHVGGAIVDDKIAPVPAIPFEPLIRERDTLLQDLNAISSGVRGAIPTSRARAIERQLEILLEPLPKIDPPVNSPVGWLLPHLAVSPFRIAPERADELRAIIADKQIVIHFDGDHSTLAEVDLKTGQVRFGIAFAEQLWILSYCYWRLFCEWQVKGPGSLLEPDKSVQMGLLSTLQAILNGDRVNWFESIPKPDPKILSSDEAGAATEIFLSVGSFVLLHEIGHICCNHKTSDPTTEWKKQEFEADDWAAKWILNRWKEYGAHAHDDIFIKRSLGGTIFTSHFTALESYRRGSEIKHPSPVKRMLRYLEKFVPVQPLKADPKEIPWVFASLIVDIYMQSSGKPIDHSLEFNEPRDFVRTAAQLLD